MYSVNERKLEENIYTPNRKAGLGLHPEKTPHADLTKFKFRLTWICFLRSYDHIKNPLNLNIFGGGKNTIKEI